MKSQLIADETHQPLAIDEVDELWNAVEIMRERFFNEEMTPRPGRREGHRHVQAVWIRDEHRIRFLGKRLVEIHEDSQPEAGLDISIRFDAQVRSDDVLQPSNPVGPELDIFT